MASPRQIASVYPNGKARSLFLECVWTMASLILFVTGVLALQADPGNSSQLGAFFEVVLGVFGLYRTALGILAILDLVCPPPAPHASTN
jgi:hypothetical protein